MTALVIPFASDVPLHYQVYELIRADILDGLYVGLDDFPGEVELAQRFQVSVATSRVVLQRLAAEGLVERGRGRRPRAVFSPHPSAATPLVVNLNLFAFDLSEAADGIAPWAACRFFGLPAGSVMWHCRRLRLLDGRPHSVALHHQPCDVGRRHGPEGLASEAMPLLLAEAGLPTVRIDCILEMRRPDVQVAAALRVNVWEKLLAATLSSFTIDRRPSDFARIFYHPDEQHSLAAVTNDALVTDQ